MKSVIATGLLAAVLVAPGVSAGEEKKEEAKSPYTFTGNFTLASEYRYRGIAQTNSKPAVQGGFDWAHESGVYLGTWASNISWLSDAGAGAVSSGLEWDFYGGYKGTIGDIGYDVGGLYYWYPGTYPAGATKPDTFEVYAAGTWQWLTAKYSYALTDLFGNVDSKGSGYLDLSGTYELGGGFNLVAHVGHQSIPSGTVNGVMVRSASDCSYTDYKLGVTTDQVGVTWGLSYIGTNAKGGVGECYRNAFNKDLGRGTVLLSVGKTF
jgi:uncharacterized protein (TIGR02001 family)